MSRMRCLCLLLWGLAASWPAAAQTEPPEISEAARACFAAGDAISEGGPPAQAVTACSAAIAEQPDDARLRAALLTGRGVAYREQRDFARALVDFDEALRLQPDSLPNANMRAWAYREMGKFDAAEAAYSQILKDESSKERVTTDRAIWQAYLSRCVVRQDLGRFQLALGDCVVALQGSRNSDTLYFAGRAYTELGRCGEAVPLLDEALRLEPVLARVYEELGYAFVCSGERRRGVTVLDNGLARYPDDPGLREMRQWAANF
jgi:tetratricopeptide (TPR) repeat protein